AGRGNRDELRSSLDWILQVIELAGDLTVDNLEIGQRRQVLGAPVHDGLVAIDEPLLEQSDENLPDRPGQSVVQREAQARPVAGSPQSLQLLHDGVAVLLFPGPDLLKKGLPPECVT